MESTDMKPSTIMLIAGGAVLLISTLLDWVSVDGGEFFGDFGANAWDTDFFGLLGIVCALIGLAVAGAVAATQFGNVSMPDRLLGFTHDQVHLVLSGFALIITLGFIFRGDVGIGLLLAVIASGVMVAASIMDTRAGDAGAAAAPPTQF